jgi:hypothetical protein
VSRRSLSSVIAVLGLAAGAGLFFVGRPAAPTLPEALPRAAEALDGKLREVAAGLHSRATTLADLPRLASAVATDAATVQDLTQDELAFRLKAGETIEIGQITKAGQALSLLRIPKESKAAPLLDPPGVSLSVAGGALMLSEVVAIQPATTDIARGAIAVSWPVDAQPIVAALDAAGTPARLEVGGQMVATTSAALPAGAERVTVPLTSAVGKGAVLVGVATTGASTVSTTRLVGLGVAALALLAAAVVARRRPANASASESLGTAATEPGVTPAGGLIAAGASVPPGGSFGRYQLTRKLGSGGMAEVYLARIVGEAGFAKDVALKIMHKSLAGVPEVVDHFLDEARLATRLNHPNIVQIIDLGKQGDDYYIAMEFVDGYDLDFLLDGCQRRGVAVPARIALAIARKICDGLHAAHTATAADGNPMDLVHRDVKAENVLISRKGEVKVADFGIAKANQRTRQTQLGVVKGTAAYMAPEHRAGKPVDRRADVYGVGAILYEMLAGYQVNLDLEALAHLGVEGWPHLRPLTQVRSDLPPGIDDLVFQALRYQRDERYASCAAFEDAIDAFATRHGVVASDKAVLQWLEAEISANERSA